MKISASNLIEGPRRRIQDGIYRKLGLVEINPDLSESELQQVNWATYCCEIALKNGADETRFIFDPQKEIEPIPGDSSILVHFKSAISSYLSQGESEHLHRIFPNAQPKLVTEVVKRLTSPKGLIGAFGGLHLTNEQISSLLERPDIENSDLRWTYSIIEHHLTKTEEEKEEDSSVMHIISHNASPQPDKIAVEKPRESFGRLRFPGKQFLVRQAQKFTRIALNSVSVPYLGASILASELEENGISKIEHHTFQDLYEDRVNLNPQDILFLTGVLSADVIKLSDKLKDEKLKDCRILVGGLAPTIDPQAFQNTTKVDIFIGELEGSVPHILEICKHSQPRERYLFRRVGSKDKTGYTIQSNNSNEGLNLVNLHLPTYVDRQEYYSPEKEKSGRLSSRTRHEIVNRQPVEIDGTRWVVPSILGETHISCGCPDRCNFCSTVRAIGQDLRKITPESLKLQLKAILPPHILEVSQNFLPGTDTPNYLEVLQEQGKKILIQSDLNHLSDLAGSHPDLLSNTVSAVLCGLEHPGYVKGSGNKRYKEYHRWTNNVREANIPWIATLIAGFGDSPEDILDWANELAPDSLIAFPKLSIPGTPQTGTTEPNDMSLEKYQLENAYSLEDSQDASFVNKGYYKPTEIFKRFIKMKGYPLRTRLGVLTLNAMISSVYILGLNVEDGFRSIRSD